MDIKLFGKRLKELRGKASQADCAAQILEKTGISLTAQTLGRYENGKRKPDIEIIEALAETFGVSADYLLCRTDVKSSDINIKTVCDYTGLHEESIKRLHSFKNSNYKNINDWNIIINRIILDGEIDGDTTEGKAGILKFLWQYLIAEYEISSASFEEILETPANAFQAKTTPYLSYKYGDEISVVMASELRNIYLPQIQLQLARIREEISQNK